MVTSLQQCGMLSSVMIMWLKRAFMSAGDLHFGLHTLQAQRAHKPGCAASKNNFYSEQLCMTKLSTSFIVCNAQKSGGTGPSLQNLRNECAESKLLLFSEYQSGKAQEGCSLLCRLMTRQAC